MSISTMASSLARACSSSLLACTFCTLVVRATFDLRAILPAVANAALFVAASHGLDVLPGSALKFELAGLELDMDVAFGGGECDRGFDDTAGRELWVSDGELAESDDFKVLEISEYVARGCTQRDFSKLCLKRAKSYLNLSRFIYPAT
jgi:hypothetical protein